MKNFLKSFFCLNIIIGALCLTGCVEKIDKSNLYTFQGQTIADYIAENEAYSHFNDILKCIEYDKLLSAYGSYTCFIPTNKGVIEYVDSLYNDTINLINPHNGMQAPGMLGIVGGTDENGNVIAPNDSLCYDIALFHLLYRDVLSIELNKGNTFNTMLNREISTSVDPMTGEVLLNGYSKLLVLDVELNNGMIHVIDHALRRSNALIANEFDKHDGFSIFSNALKVCGLDEELNAQSRTNELIIPEKEGNVYIPKDCRLGYTIFAESDEVFNKEEIFTVEDLIAKCKEWYADCAEWYDYYKSKGIEVSTGTDYGSPYNVLNIFMRYHIVKGKIPYDKLYHEDGAITSTLVSEYHESLLPYTMIKVTRVNGKPYINRWVENTSVSDQVYKYASAAIAKVRRPGLLADKEGFSSLNGYIHPINGILLYDKEVPEGVFNERMRFELMSILHESQSNNLRRPTVDEIRGMNDGVNAEGLGNTGGPVILFPENYFENMTVFNGKQTKLVYNAAYSVQFDNFQGDEFACQGAFDFALRLPPVPAGTYELRLGFSCWAGNRGMTQIYLNHPKEAEVPTISSDWLPIDIPIDMRVQADNTTVDNPDPRTGYCNAKECADYGVETDVNMRYLNYMRAPAGWYYSSNGQTNTEKELRSASWKPLRRIILRDNFEQGEYWLRFKTVLPNQTNRMLHIDYIELVPENVYNNAQYPEDMF